MRKKTILVTGGAGFIGSEFVKQAIRKKYKVVIVDKLTYAGDLERLDDVRTKISFCKIDICNKKNIQNIFEKYKPNMVVHFAAETHVDRSILDGTLFTKTNVLGTQNIIDTAMAINVERFIHISTDEVYGDIKNGKFSEDTPLSPSSPYSAAKAAADLFVKSYIRTFNFPGIIVRPSNNYGLWQYPEKFIPVIIYKALNNEKIPVYGKGLNIREWLHVLDCADGILKVLEYGKIGDIYNLGSGCEKQNLDIVYTILDIMKKPKQLIEFVQDRAGHDYRYSLNSLKLNKELGWKPSVDFKDGIVKTVNWYQKHSKWIDSKLAYLKRYWKLVYKKI